MGAVCAMAGAAAVQMSAAAIRAGRTKFENCFSKRRLHVTVVFAGANLLIASACVQREMRDAAGRKKLHARQKSFAAASSVTSFRRAVF
jgi:hypothetical protein